MNTEQLTSYTFFLKEFVSKEFRNLPISKSINNLFQLRELRDYENAFFNLNEFEIIKLLAKCDFTRLADDFKIQLEQYKSPITNQLKIKAFRKVYVSLFNSVVATLIQAQSERSNRLTEQQQQRKKKKDSRKTTNNYQRPADWKREKVRKGRMNFVVIGDFPQSNSSEQRKKKLPWEKKEKDLNIYGFKPHIIYTGMKN